jgi:hypothetical protein
MWPTRGDTSRAFDPNTGPIRGFSVRDGIKIRPETSACLKADRRRYQYENGVTVNHSDLIGSELYWFQRFTFSWGLRG